MRRDQKYTAFLDLHHGKTAFVMPNPWDAGSARVLAAEGFAALATTSAGAAVTQGLRDGAASMTRSAILSNAADIVAATDLPVSADLEDGFGLAPETCAKTIAMAAEVGLVGGSIEDATGGGDGGIMDMGLAEERIAAAAEAAKAHKVVLTARSENYLHGRLDLKDTIARLQAFEAAGADVLYAPGLPDLDAIRAVCSEVSKPVNVVMGLRPPFFTVQELSEVGVKRVSVGGSLARLAYGAVQQAMRAVLQDGEFAYADKAMPGAELMGLMRAAPTSRV